MTAIDSVVAEKAKPLLALMDDLVAMMEADGQTFWNSRVRRSAELLRRGDRQGFTEFLAGCGTSGSFNECSIGKGEWSSGKFVWHAGEEERYRHFERSKSEAFTLARQLARATEPPLLRAAVGALSSSSYRTKALVIALLLALTVLLLEFVR